MTMRLSTGLRNFLAKQGSFDDAMRNGIIEIYSGAQPASADAAPGGTLLCTISAGAGAVTSETLATGTVTLSGSAGSVNTLTVNGVEVLGAAVPFDGTLAQTALDVAAQINRNKSAPDYTASAAGAVVTIAALPDSGAAPNTFVLAGGLTTLSAIYSALTGGVAPVNGLLFDSPAAGVLPKLAAQAWGGVNSATGTAGWFREYGSVADSHALDATGVMLRVDGAIATSGAEMNLNSTAFVTGATTTLASATLTIPSQ